MFLDAKIHKVSEIQCLLRYKNTEKKKIAMFDVVKRRFCFLG